MKTSIISSETLSEFATFCRNNELDIGVNVTKDSIQLLEKQEINSMNQAIYYLQFLFVNSKQDIEKYKFLASKFFNQHFSLQNSKEQSDYTSLLSKADKEKIIKNSLFMDYLLVPNEERLKLLSYDTISSFESLDFSRPVSINYWVERIMSSSYVDEMMNFFYLTDNDKFSNYQIHELQQGFLKDLRDEIFIQLFNIKNQSKDAYDYEFLDKLVDLSEKDFLHTDKNERKELLQQTRKLGSYLAIKLKKKTNSKKKGRVSLRKTIRRSLSYGGSMFSTVHVTKIRKKPKLVVFCDISGSMALYSIFGLNFLSGLLKAFRNIRAFVFIDGATEVTEIVRSNTGDEISSILGQWNNYVKLDGHSDYSFSFESLLDGIVDISPNNLHLLVIGDARNNYRVIEDKLLSEINEKFEKIYWLNPEKKAYWSTGDSIINHFEPICESVEEVRNLNQLKIFVEKISSRLV